ncbi:MAG: hypothetical protein HPY57_12840 [Ignavibacteria bacterium]|nr:hypothetical protein [Ignavibacteria bacterium]
MKNLIKFIKDWNEIITIPIAIILWFTLPYIIRLIDNTAAFYDAGVLQQIVYAIIAVLIFHGLAWILLKITFPKVYDYLDNTLEKKYDSYYLSEWEKVKFSLFLFSLYFIAFILALKTLV